MKTIILLLFAAISVSASAQTKKGAVHGTVYGDKPDTTGVMPASRVEEFIQEKVRTSMAVRGKILKVTKPNGGWFTVDEGNGAVIAAHFKNIGVNIPTSLAGRTVIMDVVAQRLFIANDPQHYAGNTVSGKKPSHPANPKRRLTFEVKGMMVDK